MSTNKQFGVVVYGATGYTGRLVCEYLNNNKIAMAITGKANATSVAEHVMTMMLCLTKNIFESDRLVKLGKFQEKGNLPNYFELYNKKILIACLKISELSNDIKLVKVFLKFSS